MRVVAGSAPVTRSGPPFPGRPAQPPGTARGYPDIKPCARTPPQNIKRGAGTPAAALSRPRALTCRGHSAGRGLVGRGTGPAGY